MSLELAFSIVRQFAENDAVALANSLSPSRRHTLVVSFSLIGYFGVNPRAAPFGGKTLRLNENMLFAGQRCHVLATCETK